MEYILQVDDPPGSLVTSRLRPSSEAQASHSDGEKAGGPKFVLLHTFFFLVHVPPRVFLYSVGLNVCYIFSVTWKEQRIPFELTQTQQQKV